MGQTLRIWPSVPIGVAITNIHFLKADILEFMKKMQISLLVAEM